MNESAEHADERVLTFDEELLMWLGDKSPQVVERRINSEDLAVLHVVEHPAEVCAIVDAAHARQHEHGTRKRRRTVPSSG